MKVRLHRSPAGYKLVAIAGNGKRCDVLTRRSKKRLHSAALDLAQALAIHENALVVPRDRWLAMLRYAADLRHEIDALRGTIGSESRHHDRGVEDGHG